MDLLNTWADARKAMAGIVGVILLAGLASSCADDDTEGSQAVTEKHSASSGASATVESVDIKCTRAHAPRLQGIGDGAKKGVKILIGFVDDADTDSEAAYSAFAVRVQKGSKTADVIVAAPKVAGEGLTMATESALPYFVWGDMAPDGSPADVLGDFVENSDGAKNALACLGMS